MIPTTYASVNVADLEPTLALRIEAMLADRRMKGYKVVSGVRTKAHQIRLWEGWLAGKAGYNLAANPYRTISNTFDGLVIKGSYHMQQSDGYGHAVDLRKPITHSVAKAAELIGRVGRDYGLVQVALHAGGKHNNEWWHLQARNSQRWFDGPTWQQVADTYSPDPSEGTHAMLIRFGYFTYLDEGWRYRFLSDPKSVAAYEQAGIPVVKFDGENAGTWRVLRAEAIGAGRLDGEPVDVIKSYD